MSAHTGNRNPQFHGTPYQQLQADYDYVISVLKDALITIEARCRLEGIEPDASPTVVAIREAIKRGIKS